MKAKPVLTALLFWIAIEGVFGSVVYAAKRNSPQRFAQTYSNLSGVWVWSRIRSDDGTRARNVFFLQQEGSVLAGRMEFPWGGYAPFLDGAVQGNHVQFRLNQGSGDVEYSGTREGDRLHLTFMKGGALSSIELMKVPVGISIYPPPPMPPPVHSIPYKGLAKTPPMGWNAWNHFHDFIDEKTVRQIVDAMVSSGMRDAGYIYVNIDDEWAGERDADGRIHPNRNFPNMKALSAYIHSRGMKLGLYSSPGPETCEGHHGSMGNEQQDAETYAEWGVDYLKYDWCSASFLYQDADMRAVYQEMGAALQRTGRPIVYSLCQYGRDRVYDWGQSVGGNLWRTTPDIQDNWSSMFSNWKAQQPISKLNRPGAWNDPDMLEIGNGGMTEEEYRTQFSLWALLSAPLLAGNDPRHMSPSTIAILTNKDVIAIDQDTMAASPRLLRRDGKMEMWIKSLLNGDFALLLLNPTEQSRQLDLSWSDLALPQIISIQDVWQHRSVAATGTRKFDIPSHGVRMFRINTRTRSGNERSRMHTKASE